MYYKTQDNQVYFDPSNLVVNTLNLIPITDEEGKAIEAERNKQPEPTYADLRAAEYPPIEEYVDGIVKGDSEQVQAYIQKCLDVKVKYPKPEELCPPL